MPTRVGILTFLHNDNYGSLLQAWALQEQLRQLGCEVRHLDYAPDNREKIRNLLRSGNSPTLILDGLQKRKVKQQHLMARAKSESLRSFREKHLILSSPCANGEALKKAAADCDVLIAGSDQIWSPEWLNERYFLTFASERQHRLAYAASLGIERCPQGRKRKLMADWLQGYDAISVREKAGAEIIRQLTGSEPEVLPDPVILQRRQDWLALSGAAPVREPYLLAYFIGNQPIYWSEARKMAARHHLRLQVIPVQSMAWQEGGVDCLTDLSPEAWLGAFAHAERVITDSFHGVAFSCLLERPFTALRRYEEGSAGSKNSRIQQLLSDLKLPWEGAEMNAKACQRLEELRLQGQRWLRNQLCRL